MSLKESDPLMVHKISGSDLNVNLKCNFTPKLAVQRIGTA